MRAGLHPGGQAFGDFQFAFLTPQRARPTLLLYATMPQMMLPSGLLNVVGPPATEAEAGSAASAQTDTTTATTETLLFDHVLRRTKNMVQEASLPRSGDLVL